MPKRPRHRPRKGLQEYSQISASNISEINPDVTVGPEASLESTRQDWMGPESTSAPAIGEDEEREYVSDGFGFLDKFLQGRVSLNSRSVFLLVTLGWFGFISWLYTKDNDLGRLDSLDGIKWFGVKAVLYTGFYVLVAIILRIFSRSNSKK